MCGDSRGSVVSSRRQGTAIGIIRQETGESMNDEVNLEKCELLQRGQVREKNGRWQRCDGETWRDIGQPPALKPGPIPAWEHQVVDDEPDAP